MWPFKNKSYKPDSPTTTRLLSYSNKAVVTADTAMKASAFYSGVIYVSTQIAKLPWLVKDENNKIIKDQISKILNLRPNNEMSAFQLKCFLLQEAIIKGNGYAEIVRDTAGRVTELYPIPNSAVEPMRLEDGRLVYRIVNGSLQGTGDVFLFPKDIFHAKNFYTKDGITGQGLIEYGSEVLGIAISSDKLASGIYSNGGLPSGVLEVPGRLSTDAAKRLQDSWGENHSGRKVGGTAVLEEGAAFKPISYSPSILQFLDSRKFSVLEIARYLRVPPTKLYDADTAKFKNIEQSNLEVATDTLDAWAKNLESEADIKLLGNSHSGRHTEMDLYAVFRGDMDTRSQYFSRMMQNAAMTPNEMREKEGLAPYKDGDRYYIATNNFSPVDRLDELVDKQVSTGSEKTENTESVDNVVVNYLKERTKD